MEGHLRGFDHIVLAVEDVAVTCDFYRRVLGMRPSQPEAGRWVLSFEDSMISVRRAGELSDMASGTTPGSANFCVLTTRPINEVADHLVHEGVAIALGPTEKLGALGPMMSVYFHDPDGNLVEVAELLG